MGRFLKIGFCLVGLAITLNIVQLTISVKPAIGWFGVLPLLLSLAALIIVVVVAIKEID